jgi:replicative DNA helicase
MTINWQPKAGWPAPVFDRTPPQNIEAERSVLGAMLLNPDAVGTAVEILHGTTPPIPSMSTRTSTSTARSSSSPGNNIPVDMVTLSEALTRDGALEKSGGAGYIAELTDAVPTSANVEYYAKIVLEGALRRKLITICTRMRRRGLQERGRGGRAPRSRRVRDLQHRAAAPTEPDHRVSELLEEGIKRIEQQMKNEGRHHRRAHRLLQARRNALRHAASDMIILAAQGPSVGKTAFCLNVAANAAKPVWQGRASYSASKWPRNSSSQRLLCMVGQVDSNRLRSGFLARSEFPKLQQAAGCC